MSVRYDKARSKWIADYVDALGVRRAPTFDSKAEARAHEARGAARSRRSAPVDSTFADTCEVWLETCLLKGLKPQTVDGYRTTVRDHLGHLSRRPVRDIERSELQQLFRTKLAEGYQRSTVGRWIVITSAIFEHAVQTGLTDRNPARGVGRLLGASLGGPRTRRGDIKALTRDQLRSVLQETSRGLLHPYICLMAWAGLRQGEVLALRWSDVRSGVIRVSRTAVRQYGVSTPKGGSGRLVPVASQLAEVLAKADHQSDWLFPEMVDPKPSTIGRLQGRLDREVRRAGTAVGCQASCHGLRHTFATQLLLAGVSPAKVQAWLGHASIETTIAVYGSWMPYTDDSISLVAASTSPEHDTQ